MSKTLSLNIKGMHCRSCEILLERDIAKVKGVKKVKTNFKRGLAEIHYDDRLDISAVERAIQAAGYSLGKEDKESFFSRKFEDYMDLAATASVLFIVYLLLKGSGLLDFNLNIDSTPSFITVLVIGLTAGVSSCMALVGGLVLGISARHAELHPEATARQKFTPHLFFNLGRLVSYAILGGLIGLIGSALSFSTVVLGLISVGIGLVMLLLGLKLIEIFPRLSNKGIYLPKGISRLLGLGHEVKEYSHRGSFITGALTFFVPCGFTQAMQLYAVSTGSFTQGAMIMFLFALGTMPGILGIGGITSVVKGAFSRYFFKFAGLVVIAFAVWNISNGFTLTGFTFASGSSDANNNSYGNIDVNALAQPDNITMEDGKQVARMEQGNGYSPNIFTVKKGIPVKWIITSTSYNCGSALVVPALRYSGTLKQGENVIEFTPTDTGVIRFMCAMGMYRGEFNVVN